MSLGAALNVAPASTAEISSIATPSVTTGECTVDGTLTGTDDFAITGPLTLSGGTLSTTGTTDAEDGMTITGGDLEYGTLNNYGAATWSGTIGMGDGATINNLSGASFDAQGDESLGYVGGAAGTFDNDPGATFDAANDGNGGTQMALSFNNAGTVDLGSPATAGLLTINGNYTQTASGSLDFDLGGTTAGSEYSQLAVFGLGCLGRRLNVPLLGGFVPVVGDSFLIVASGTTSGTFTMTSGLAIGQSSILDLTATATGATLTVDDATVSGIQSAINSTPANGSVTIPAASSGSLDTSVQALNTSAPTGAVTVALDLGGATTTPSTPISASQ